MELDFSRVDAPFRIRVVIVDHHNHVGGALFHVNWRVWLRRVSWLEGWGGGGEEWRWEACWSLAGFQVLLGKLLAHFMDEDAQKIYHAQQGEIKYKAGAIAQQPTGDGQYGEYYVEGPCKEEVDRVEDVVEEIVDRGGVGKEVFEHVELAGVQLRCLVLTC